MSTCSTGFDLWPQQTQLLKDGTYNSFSGHVTVNAGKYGSQDGLCLPSPKPCSVPLLHVCVGYRGVSVWQYYCLSLADAVQI